MGNSSLASGRSETLEATKAVVAHPPPTKWQRLTNRINDWKWTILRALPLGVLLPVTIFFGSVGPEQYVTEPSKKKKKKKKKKKHLFVAHFQLIAP